MYVMSLPWTWYLAVPAIIWGAGFILVDRMRHPQRPSKPGEPLLHCAKESLTQVEHQIWLLRNVLWWYLLPFSISILAFLVHVAWQSSSVWWEFVVGSLIFVGSVLLILLGSAPFFGFELPLFSDSLRPFITQVLSLGAMRGLLIGVGLGTLATGIRILVGSDRPFGGS